MTDENAVRVSDSGTPANEGSRQAEPAPCDWCSLDLSEHNAAKPKKVLVLHVEVPGVWADDLDEMATEHYDSDQLEAVLDDGGMGLHEFVGLTVLITGDEGGPMVRAFDCRVIGAEARDLIQGEDTSHVR